MGKILAFNTAALNKVAFTDSQQAQITALIEEAVNAGLELDRYKFHTGKFCTAFCLYTKDNIEAPYIVLSKEKEGGPYRYRLTTNEMHNWADSLNFNAILPQIKKVLELKQAGNDNSACKKPTNPEP